MAGEGSGSARRSSRFTMTCSLLRQYMAQDQDQEQLAKVARLLQTPPPQLPAVAPPARENMTKQVFPVRTGSAMAHPAQQRPEVMVASMTISYGGHVIRVDNVPADKGIVLMRMAQSASAPPPPPEKLVVVDVPDEESEVVAGPSTAITAIQARRLSLQRFLRKRKERWGKSSHYRDRAISFGINDPDYNDDELPPKKMAGGGGEPWEDDVPDASWLSL